MNATLHACRWPGCQQKVGEKFICCKPHWSKVPQRLRARVWAYYRPGLIQVGRYVEAVQAVYQWIDAQ